MTTLFNTAISGRALIDFSDLPLRGFDASQDLGDFTISADGRSLIQESQSWEQLVGNFEITADTRLQFEFSAQTEGDIHGIMFLNGTELSDATTIQVYGSQTYGIQEFNDYGTASGLRSYDIALGEHFTGTFDRMIFLTDDDAEAGADSTWRNVTLTGADRAAAFDFSDLPLRGFDASQDLGDFTISADGRSLIQESQSWEQLVGNFEITADTRLQFEFSAQTEGDIHGIMFLNGTELSDATTIQVYGSQTYGIQEFNDYGTASGLRSYDIALGEHFTGTFDRMIFLTDDDAEAGADSTWRNVTLTGADRAAAFDFSDLPLRGFDASQDLGDFTISADGRSLIQESQSWEQLVGNFEITADTRLQFEFSAQTEGDIHGIMFLNGTELSDATTIQVYGSQTYGIQEFNDYGTASGLRSYDIALGEHFTGTFDRMIFLTDDDAEAGADSTWRNVTLTGADDDTVTQPDSSPTPPPDNTPPDAIGSDDIISGRVSTIVPETADIASIRVLSPPAHGNLTVNPDKTLSLVLTGTDYTGPLDISYEVTGTSGAKRMVSDSLKVLEGPIENGWGLGDFYMLETDDNGAVTVEWGDNHRDVYVSGRSSALTREEIAIREGLTRSDINGAWLRDHPEYGSRPGLALAEDAGRALWRALVEDTRTEPASHWLRLEAGYEYNMGGTLYDNMQGESALHPIHITAYGSGAKPVLTEHMAVAKGGATHLVFSNVEIGAGLKLNPSTNVLLDNITSSPTSGDTLVVQRVDGFTLRNSEIYDTYRAEPVDGGYWAEGPNKISGIFSADSNSLLIENSLFDRNGWAEDYIRDLRNSDAQPPSIFNHNIYLASTLTDVTFRDSISMQASSFGAQFRSGAVVEDSVFLDNNGAVFVAGGNDGAGNYAGNYSLYSGNLVTSGAHRPYGDLNGQQAGGIGDYAPLTALLGNIVTHLADPNNPAEQERKAIGNHAAIIGGAEATVDDTIIYNWRGIRDWTPQEDANLDGLDTDILDRTTIQRFAADLLGERNATISDLADYLRASAKKMPDGTSDAALILDFFRDGFGIDTDVRTAATTLRFVPDATSDGVRWDNRLNWSTEDLPGTVAGDRVDLADNWVNFVGDTEIRNLDLGDRGVLAVTGGRLDVTGQLISTGADARVDVTNAGQIWIEDYTGPERVAVAVDNGRFAVTGGVDGRIDLDISGGQALLATAGARFDLVSSSRINIDGSDAKVGFDGTSGGTAVLRLEAGSTLGFAADAGGLGQIGEFRSGSNGTAETRVNSGIHLGEADLEIDLSGLAADHFDFVLMSADEIIGAFSEISLSGLAHNRDASVVFDYGTDEVILSLSARGAGTGSFDISTRGNQYDAQANNTLWRALTSTQDDLAGNVVPDSVILNGDPYTDFL